MDLPWVLCRGQGKPTPRFLAGGCRAYMVGVGRQLRPLYSTLLLLHSSGGMFYQPSNDDKEIAREEWGLIKDPLRDNPLVRRHRRRVKNNPILALNIHKDKRCLENT